MAFAGLKKQINKANQYMTEKMGGAEGTKMDDDFVTMEKRTDITYELVEELQLKTKEYLQPNPTARAKMAAVKGISKLSGQAKASTYPQPEGVLGECMTTYGQKLEDCIFGVSLIEMGESLKQMADAKYALDDSIKQNFLEPLHHLQTKDLKEVMHHRKKLQGRRLDFDCKKRKQSKAGSHIGDEEIKLAEDKFAESLHLAQVGMHNLLDNEVEQVSQLAMFAVTLRDYHQNCTEIMKALADVLQEKQQEAASQPKREFVPKTVSELTVGGLNFEGATSPHTLNGGPPPYHSVVSHGTTPQRSPLPSPSNPKPPSQWGEPLFPQGNAPRSTNASPLPSPMRSPTRPLPGTNMNRGPCCQALYDFEPENPGELGFKEGDTITLVNRIDENWYEGTVDGRTGYFPVSYVQVTVPLP